MNGVLTCVTSVCALLKKLNTKIFDEWKLLMINIPWNQDSRFRSINPFKSIFKKYFWKCVWHIRNSVTWDLYMLFPAQVVEPSHITVGDIVTTETTVGDAASTTDKTVRDIACHHICTYHCATVGNVHTVCRLWRQRQQSGKYLANTVQWRISLGQEFRMEP